MTQQPPVHIEPREKGWAVVREGSERASSLHPTQAEAAKEGRDIARREKTEFFLHAQDGRVREHRSYETPSADKGIVGQAAETVAAVSSGITASTLETARGAGTDAGPEVDRSGDPTHAGSDDKTSDEETSYMEEVRGLADAERDDRFGTPEERYAGYEIYGQDGERIGKLDDLFVDEYDNPEYVGVRTGSSATESTLIPADVVAVDDRLRRMVVSRPKGVVEAGPSLGHDEEVTPELEERVRGHYGLATTRDTGSKSGYGAYYRDGTERAGKERGGSGAALPGAPTVPFEAGQVRGHDREGLGEPGILEGEEELRVRRSEEELRVGTREHEAGAVRVRKRVRTDRERIRVPKKRVEVTVERVPVEGEAARPEIGEDEIVVPVIEEEVVVEKRPVVKEEIRIRKKVVEDTEVVEEDVRREEVDVEDQTERGHPAGERDQ
jgi:uncharacterized protein (TIGR02271 family)